MQKKENVQVSSKEDDRHAQSSLLESVITDTEEKVGERVDSKPYVQVTSRNLNKTQYSDYEHIGTQASSKFPNDAEIDFYSSTSKDTGEIAISYSDIESGLSIVSEDVNFRSFQTYNEVELLGFLWRWCLKQYILATYDEVNALRITRTLQLFLFTQTGYEAYLICEVIIAFNSKDRKRLSYALCECFKNRNVSRAIVRSLRPTWDYVWHWDTLFKHGKFFDSFQQTFFFTGFGFPASENFVNTRDFTAATLLRLVLGEGNFITRSITGRQALQTDQNNVVAQNLAAETTGFETANRNQFGSYIGRLKTKAFRRQHRLPVDESIVRSFQANPIGTVTNNGIEHVVGQLARHWRNMLYQEQGNFAHQRMEQLNPFQFLRFQLPPLLVVMTTVRGSCSWDVQVLAPFVSKLQLIKSSDDMVAVTKAAISELKDIIAVGVCGGVASRLEAFLDLVDSLDVATDMMTKEAYEIEDFCQLKGVDRAISMAKTIYNFIDWKLPSDSILKRAILSVCAGSRPQGNVDQVSVNRALNLLAPKDKRTLKELIKGEWNDSHPATLLVNRSITLLQRELRRDLLDAKLVAMSKGSQVSFYKVDRSYWLIGCDISGIYTYTGFDSVRNKHLFHNLLTNHTRKVGPKDGVKVLIYKNIAVEIAKAQWSFMKIELDFGKKFTYSGFMEYPFLRERLRFLVVVSQWHSYVLDDARLDRLQSVQSMKSMRVKVEDLQLNKTYYRLIKDHYEPFSCTDVYSPDHPHYAALKAQEIRLLPPQSMIVIGGGPAGLLCTLHCLENVLLTAGTMTLFESRDAFTQGGATFERSQIVRLDARWIAMLRFYLGTIYEDVFVPAAGETDSHYGNNLPAQGFIEITIKDLENMLNVQVAKASSRGLLNHYTNSNVLYDYKKGHVVKLGKALVIGDLLLRNLDPDGNESEKLYSWKVVELAQADTVPLKDLLLGEEYVIYVPSSHMGVACRLMAANLRNGEYMFQYLDSDKEILVSVSKLPSIYPKSTKLYTKCQSIIIQCTTLGSNNSYAQESLAFGKVEVETFALDIGQTHVVSAIGKPHNSPTHFAFTTYEPYGVCCLSGLKVSMGMHNFGTRRWEWGIVDDIRGSTDQNTRVVGDFTKIVNTKLISKQMVTQLKDDPNWRWHFEKVVADLGFDTKYDFFTVLVTHVKIYRDMAPYKRSHVQTRFFETGDNFYLGMEFTREYDNWKLGAVRAIASSLFDYSHQDRDKNKKLMHSLQAALSHHIDRLWYDATLETIRTGDVYNPGGRSFVPRLYLVDSLIETTLANLDIAESFLLADQPSKRFEILMKNPTAALVRDHEGYLTTMSYFTQVRLGGNLTRAPDGVSESKVAIATFPVAHYLNHRAMVLSNTQGYTFAFLGDEQSSPHFMRYSGLTGAAINCMLFDQFIEEGILLVPLQQRMRNYCSATNWSNGEVVQRGTTSNYGEDGFLRPGFAYAEAVKYLAAKVMECTSTGQEVLEVLSRDWLIKFAAALIPRGMEFNSDFISILTTKWYDAVFSYLIVDIQADKQLDGVDLSSILMSRSKCLEASTMDGRERFWMDLVQDIPVEARNRLIETHIFVAKHLEMVLHNVIEKAQDLKTRNDRLSTQADNQLPSVDVFIDDFAIEVQATTNILVLASIYASIALAITFVTMQVAALFSAVFFWFSLGTVSNTSRYKNRNDEWRVLYFDEGFVKVGQAVFACMKKAARRKFTNDQSPFFKKLDNLKTIFVQNVHYYDLPEPLEFIQAYEVLSMDINDAENIQAFMRNVVAVQMADVYHVNSYLQEDLVNIYSAAEAMHHMVISSDVSLQASELAEALFDRLSMFKRRFESSLDRGKILFGFSKVRNFRHWHVCTLFMYVWTWLWIIFRKYTSPAATAAYTIKPVAAENWDIIEELMALQSLMPVDRPSELHREILDMTSLYYATMESYTSSYIVCSGWLSFFTGGVFFIGNVSNVVSPLAAWANSFASAGRFVFGSITPITSLAAAWYLLRQLRHIISCAVALAKRRANTTDVAMMALLDNVLFIFRLKAVITAFRFAASLAAGFALPFALVQMEKAYPGGYHMLWLAMSAVTVQIVCNVILFWVEYNPLYNLSPNLGASIGQAFERDIMNLKQQYTALASDIRTTQEQDREAWEYTARAFLHKYRFDSSLGANRFGSIMHYFMCGGLKKIRCEGTQHPDTGSSVGGSDFDSDSCCAIVGNNNFGENEVEY